MFCLAVTVGAGYHFPKLLVNEEVLVVIVPVLLMSLLMMMLLTLTKSEQEPPEQYSIMIQRFAPLRNEAKYLWTS